MERPSVRFHGPNLNKQNHLFNSDTDPACPQPPPGGTA